jgi:hypothetical protein
MIRRLALIVFGLCCLLVAAEGPKQKLQVGNTQRLDFPPGGLLTLKNSIGELWIRGEDRPDVSIATTKSTKAEYDARNREIGTRELDQVLTTAERHGDELVVSTTYPRHGVFAPPLRGGTRFDLVYDIRVPRNARVAVDHDNGYVFVDNVMSDVHVTVRQGSITLRPAEGQYAIDAASKFGSVSSDFPGHAQRKFWFVGRQFLNAGPSSAHKIYLRVGYGDIILLEPAGPSLAYPRTN